LKTKTIPLSQTIQFCIVLQSPPAGVIIGLQQGKGSSYLTIQKQSYQGKDLRFYFEATVKNAKDGSFDLGGPEIQGVAGQRFVYLDIGTYAGQADSVWSRRLKIPLTGLADLQLEPGWIFLAEVAGTGKDGGPSCGTAKPFNGWKLVMEKEAD
jgi:hypothetical protein